MVTTLILQSIRDMRDDLRSFDWLSWVEIRDGAKVSDNRFWKSLEDVLKAYQPFVMLMRLADADAQPCMDYLLNAFDKAKKSV